MCEMKPPFDDA